jgi:hypothetical protein
MNARNTARHRGRRARHYTGQRPEPVGLLPIKHVSRLLCIPGVLDRRKRPVRRKAYKRPKDTAMTEPEKRQLN